MRTTAPPVGPGDVGEQERGARARRRWWLALCLCCLVAVAVLTTIWAAQRAAAGVEAAIDARLVAAGAGANAALVQVEASQLSTLRAITFTPGVGAAMASRAVGRLDQLVTPVQANSGVPMVDLVLPDGQVEEAVRSKGAPNPVASRKGMPAIAQALQGADGPRGGRLTSLVIFKSGPTLVTAGPVLDNGSPVGVALVMTPLADVLGRLSQEVGATLTAYDLTGAPIATTATTTVAPLPAALAKRLLEGRPVLTRTVDGTRQAFGRLVGDHQSIAVLGVSVPDDSWVTGWAVALYVALGMLGVLGVVGGWALRVRYRRSGAPEADDEPR